MRKSKLGRIFLAAVLALTLGASSALAVEPTPAESYRNGTVTFQVSFDLEATDGLVTNAKAGKSQASTPYAPEFTGLTAYTTGINGTLKQFTEAVTTVSNIPSGDVYKESAIEALVRTMTLYGSIFNQTALKSAAKTVGYSGGTRFIDEYTTAATYAESDDKALKPFPATNEHYDIVEAIGRMNKAFAKAFVGQAYNASATAFTADEIKAMREQLATALAKADFGANNADGVNPALATMAIGEIITAVGSALAAGASEDVITIVKTLSDDVLAGTKIAEEAQNGGTGLRTGFNAVITNSGTVTPSSSSYGTLGNYIVTDDRSTGYDAVRRYLIASRFASRTNNDKDEDTYKKLITADVLKGILAELAKKTVTGSEVKGVKWDQNSASADVAEVAINADEANNSIKMALFWGYAALNPDAFKAMLPAISDYLVKNPTATMVDLAEQLVTLNPAINAVNAYLSSFLSEDALEAGNTALEWSTDVTYTKPTGTVKVTTFAGKNPTINPAFAVANAVSGDVKDTITSPAILRMELASKDSTGKFVYGPVDVTEGIELTDALLAQKEVTARAILLAPGDTTGDAVTKPLKSVGILTESDKEGYSGTIPQNTLEGSGSLYNSDLEDLKKAYPYMVEFTMQFVTSGDAAADSSSDGTAAAETYALKADSIDLVGSDGQKLSVAAGTKYATSQDKAATDALWTTAPVVFSVSSDQLASFEITVSTDNAVIAVTDDEGNAIEVTSKKFATDGIEGTYTIILSADLVASSDAKTVSTDKAYFAIEVDVVSVDAGTASGSVTPASGDAASGDSAASGDQTASGDTTPGSDEGEGEATTPATAEDAETTTDASGNTVAADGQTIENAFTGSAAATAISNLLNSATEAEQASTEDVAGALGISEDQVGNAEDGYKAIGMEVPAGVTLPAENTPFFVITRHSSGRNHVGFGYMPKRRPGFERILAILFNLLKDPANTTNYMTVEAGDNTVAATDSTGTTSGDTSTVNRVVFVAADGTAFALKTEGTVPLQGQSAAGVATPIDTTSGGDDDDDDNNSTSRHGGGSSGCDAGFGLIALAAVALAARKIRK